MGGGKPHTKTPVSALGTIRTWCDITPMTVTVTPRPPVVTAHTFTLPTVRELPPVARPGTFDATW
jgi:hypothetical protein